MSGSVIVRGESWIAEDGSISHDDKLLSWEQADARAGLRLDRRRKWGFVEGELCASISWTQSCSGCADSYQQRGSGCDECGYHGVVRSGCWAPASVILGLGT